MSDAEKHGYGRYGTLEIHGMTLVCWSVFKPFVPLLSLLSFARPSHIRLYTTRADKSSHASSCFSNLAIQASKESKVLVFIPQKNPTTHGGPRDNPKGSQSTWWTTQKLPPVSVHMGMDQYLLIPFLVGWTSIYQLFWCSPGVQGFDTLPYRSRSGHAAVISRTAGDQCLWSPLRRALRCNRCPSGCPEPVGCPWD